LKEENLYDPIRTYLLEKFNQKFKDTILEDTHSGGFSQKIKKEIPEHREIIFSFLTKEKPDLIGYVKETYSVKYITVEIKNTQINLNDVYQAKKYADLFEAKYGFLISSKAIPDEIKRLHKKTSILRTTVDYERLILAEWDISKNEVVDWFEISPFQ
jgi:hypothetical protein